MTFLDRRDAGRQLAEQLTVLGREDPIVIALPPGGVPVAFEIAGRLRAPLDVLAVGEVPAPGNSQRTAGTITEDGAVALSTSTEPLASMTDDLFDAAFARELRTLRSRAGRYRGGRQSVGVRGRTVIVVDDGAHTEVEKLAAVRNLRARGAVRIVVATPVGADDLAATIGQGTDMIVCRARIRAAAAVSTCYQSFAPVSDAQVLALLDLAASAHAPTPGQMPPPERAARPERPTARQLRLEIDEAILAAELLRPRGAQGLVICADGDGLSRASLRNRELTAALNQARFATLLADLCTEEEQRPHAVEPDLASLAHRL